MELLAATEKLLQIAGEVELYQNRLRQLEERFGIKAGFNANQPRVPSGSREGGRWTIVAGVGVNTDFESIERNREIIAGMTQDELLTEAGLVTLGIAAPYTRVIPFLQRVNLAIRAANWRNKWVLGKHKSALQWENRMKKRGWTPEDITETIKKGKKFNAPNKVNPGNGATRFQNPRTGKYVVRDNTTKEILQISGNGEFYPEK